jgi:hypothetical protein
MAILLYTQRDRLGVQREAKDISIVIIRREWDLEKFTAPKVPRRCPLVLL